MGPTMVPSRTRRALSIALFTFSERCFLSYLKYKIPPEKRQNLGISWTDSLESWFQWTQRWIQTELDEPYPLHYLSFPKNPPLDSCEDDFRILFPCGNRNYKSRSNTVHWFLHLHYPTVNISLTSSTLWIWTELFKRFL